MIARHLTHLKHAVGKSVENGTIVVTQNNNLRLTHEMHQCLTRDEMIHIAKESIMLKTSSSTTTNPNRATEGNDSDCKSLI